MISNQYVDGLEEYISELRKENNLLKSVIKTALYGTLLDGVGNRDEDGLIPFGQTKTATKVLKNVLKAGEKI